MHKAPSVKEVSPLVMEVSPLVTETHLTATFCMPEQEEKNKSSQENSYFRDDRKFAMSHHLRLSS